MKLDRYFDVLLIAKKRTKKLKNPKYVTSVEVIIPYPAKSGFFAVCRRLECKTAVSAALERQNAVSAALPFLHLFPKGFLNFLTNR